MKKVDSILLQNSASMQITDKTRAKGLNYKIS